MVVYVEVILRTSILVVRPMLASLLTHCCVIESFCGVGGKMIFVRETQNYTRCCTLNLSLLQLTFLSLSVFSKTSSHFMLS